MVVILIFIIILSLNLFSKWCLKGSKAFSGCLEPHPGTVPPPTSCLPGICMAFHLLPLDSPFPSMHPAIWLLPPSTGGDRCREVPVPLLPSFLIGDLGTDAGWEGIEHVLHGAGRAVAVPHLGWQQHSTISRCFNRDLSPTLIQVVSDPMRRLQSPWVISPLWIGVASQWEGDIDFPTPVGAPHLHFALEPTNYIADPEWKWCKT